MNNDKISIRGARTHNLKDIDLDIKIESITCLTGPSGSGKTSLAFHTLLNESKRRFLNSFPTDVKFFWDLPHTVDVDQLSPVLPVWGLAQHNPVVGSRPAVIDHLDLLEKYQKLFTLAGQGTCSDHGLPFVQEHPVDRFISLLEDQNVPENEAIHIAVQAHDYKKYFADDALPVRSFNELSGPHEFVSDDAYWEVFRLKKKMSKKKMWERFAELTQFLQIHEFVFFSESLGKAQSMSLKAVSSCPKCGQLEERSIYHAQSLSPYNALGACSECQGHGSLLVYDNKKIVKDDNLSLKQGAVHLLNYSRFQYLLPAACDFFKKNKLDPNIPFWQLPKKKWKLLYEGGQDFPGVSELLSYLERKRYKKNVRIYLRGLKKEVLCPTCQGTRVGLAAGNLTIFTGENRWSYAELLKKSLEEAHLVVKLIEQDLQVGSFENKTRLFKTIQSIKRVHVSCSKMNLGHIGLSTKVRSLSAGVYQRLLLIKFTSFEGSGSLLVLDEPSLGLNIQEQKVLLQELRKVQKQGNTVLMIDHSILIQGKCDEIIEMGPKAGDKGGKVIYQGPYVKKGKGHKASPFPLTHDKSWAKIKKLKKSVFSEKNLKIQKYALNTVIGNSASGKNEIIFNALVDVIKFSDGTIREFPGDLSWEEVSGLEDIKTVHVFDGSVGRVSSRSTLGTMLELTPQLRKHYASLDVSKSLGLEKGHFSPNSQLGKCQACEGRGVQVHDMQFLEDVQFACPDCKGMKLKPFYALISDGKRTYHESVSQPLSSVLPDLKLTPKYKRVWEYIKLLNLEYLSLDRTFSSLSGGERLRVKLLSELLKNIHHGLLVFENLSFGLGEKETHELLKLLERLVNDQNTVLLVDESPILTQASHNVLKL